MQTRGFFLCLIPFQLLLHDLVWRNKKYELTRDYYRDANRGAVTLFLLRLAIRRMAALRVAIETLERGFGGC